MTAAPPPPAAAPPKPPAGAPPPPKPGAPPPAAPGAPAGAAGAKSVLGAPGGKSVAGKPPGPPPAAPAVQNKQDEPPFQLKLEPDRIIFKSADFCTPSDFSLNIVNTSKARQCYKVKCTSNDVFRVRPPLGFIEAGQSAKVEFCFGAKEIPAPAKHFFAFYHVACKDDEKAVRNVWTPSAKPDGCRRVMAEFQKADGAPATPGPIAGGGSQLPGTAPPAAAGGASPAAPSPAPPAPPAAGGGGAPPPAAPPAAAPAAPAAAPAAAAPAAPPAK